MTAAAPPVVRPVMVWVPETGTPPLDLALEWARRLRVDGAPDVVPCIWATRDTRAPVPHPYGGRVCWHDLDIPRRVDRHVPASHPDLEWSPWGTKSGPNFQFFSLLDAFPRVHDDAWALLLEPDTLPAVDDVAEQVARLVAAHPDAWIIGGQPHELAKPALARELRAHLNGAALYRVGSRGFAEFRTGVWLPSLLVLIQRDPAMAFDCLTDPSLQQRLPAALREAWARRQHHFVPTAGIVNVSSLELTRRQLVRLMSEPALRDACDREGTRPWLLHAKGDVAGALADLQRGTSASLAAP